MGMFTASKRVGPRGGNTHEEYVHCQQESDRRPRFGQPGVGLQCAGQNLEAVIWEVRKQGRAKVDDGSTKFWLDYSIFESQIPVFIRIGRNIKNSGLDVITVRNEDSPTARYYRQNQSSAAAG